MAAINEGIQKAAGDIIAYINSDDTYLPGTFAAAVRYFEEHPEKQWLVGNCLVSEPVLAWTFRIKWLIPFHRFAWTMLLFDFINQPSVFLRIDFARKVGLFDLEYHFAFDYEYWLRCIRLSLPGRINQYLAVFRVQPQSKSSENYSKQFVESLKIARQYTPNPVVIWAQKIITAIASQVYRSSK